MTCTLHLAFLPIRRNDRNSLRIDKIQKNYVNLYTVWLNSVVVVSSGVLTETFRLCLQ